MTVKELIRKFRNVDEFTLSWDGIAHAFDADDLILMDAFGNYLVDGIFVSTFDADRGEVKMSVDFSLALTPAKKGVLA